MCRVAASAGGLDALGMERTAVLGDRLEGRPPAVGSAAMGLSSFLRRSERGELVVRRGDASSVMRVDRQGGSSAFGTCTPAEPLDRGPSLVFEMEVGAQSRHPVPAPRQPAFCPYAASSPFSQPLAWAALATPGFPWHLPWPIPPPAHNQSAQNHSPEIRASQDSDPPFSNPRRPASSPVPLRA